MRELTHQRKRFVLEYLKDFNGTQAAIRAGYSERTAGAIAHELLKKPEVLETVADAATGILEEVELDAQYVARRLREVDEMDILDILDDGGNLRPLTEWPRVWRTTLSGMELAELWEGAGDQKLRVGDLRKIKWPDKVKNLELIGKLADVAAFREQVGHSGPKGGPIETTTTVVFEPVDD